MLFFANKEMRVQLQKFVHSWYTVPGCYNTEKKKFQNIKNQIFHICTKLIQTTNQKLITMTRVASYKPELQLVTGLR